MNHDLSSESWTGTLAAWNIDPTVSAQWFDDVRGRYSEPTRHYHNLVHIHQVLTTVESLRAHARNPNAVKLAVWLHDVVYDGRASDNEERSADYAERLCASLSIPEGRRIASLILATKTHDTADDPDAEVLLDADLAVLGASEAEYRVYAENIRREYAWVPEAEYRAGRRRVLETFLARPRIFRLLVDLETPARRNLAAEIA